MTSDLIFLIIVLFLCFDFVWERGLEYLNLKHMSPCLPKALIGIYNETEYRSFQDYKRQNGRLDFWSSVFDFVVMISFLVLGGFGWYNGWVVSLTGSVIGQTSIFILGVSLVASVLDIPFDYYATFKIEEKYGFNTSTKTLFWTDKLKGICISLLMGGVVLVLITWFYTWAGVYFWLYAWGGITLFSLFMSLFYSQLIVPLFNKQTPLEEGGLRDKIQSYAERVGFKLDNIYVIDGSKRSTKANAYFTGVGPKKRVVLYDTLIKELTEEEIVAVLAHEIGHYKKRHTLKGMFVSVLEMGVMLGLFSFFVNNTSLSLALGGDRAYFQLGLVAFAILYSPISTVLGIAMNSWSRKNEYEADAYAAVSYNGNELISGLKKISVKALSNLTPHPLYEFVYYSHPSLLKRIDAISKINDNV